MTVKANAAEPAFIEVDMEMNTGAQVEKEKEKEKVPATARADLRPTLSTPALASSASTATDGDVIDLDSFEQVQVNEGGGGGAGRDPDVSGARAFAISDAIRLLQSLPPAPRVDMVVRVVRVTLGSANVSVEEMGEEIARRSSVLEQKIEGLRRQADELEKQLLAKEAEIAGQNAELKHLVSVKARLQMTTQPPAHRPPPIPRAALKQGSIALSSSTPIRTAP